LKQWDLRGVTLDLSPPGPGPREMVASDVAQARVLLDQFPALLWTTDASLRLTSCLGTELAAMGFWSNQLVGVRVDDLFDPAAGDLPAIAAHHRALRGERVTFDMRLAGRRFHAHVGPLIDAAGHPIGCICIALEGSLVPARRPLAVAG